MKIRYKILYRNGIEDVVSIDMDDINMDDLRKITDVLERGFRENVSGIITLGNRRDSGTYIRIDDVTRVSVTMDKEDD